MEETGTAGWMTWPASHCPLLGRVVPSPADVSSGAKERTGREREEKEPSVTFHFSPGGAFQLPWSRPLAPEMGQVTSDRSRE